MTKEKKHRVFYSILIGIVLYLVAEYVLSLVGIELTKPIVSLLERIFG